MSLATTGGGGGLGGGGLSTAAMAHGGPNAQSIAQTQPTHTHSQIPGGGSGSGFSNVPLNVALGADLLDKNQSFITSKNVRNVAKLPIVAIDIYGDQTSTSYYPPLSKDDTSGDGNENEMIVMMRAMEKLQKGVLARTVTNSTSGDYYDGTNVTLKKDDTASYKAIKKYLNNGEGYGNVLDNAMITNKSNGKKSNNGDSDIEEVIIIPRPHLLLGLRNVTNMNDAAKSTFASILPTTNSNNTNNNVIDQDDNTNSIALTTISLDGATTPNNDDYDRVAYSMRLSSKKKLMTILPEEALGLIIAQCKKHVLECYLKEVGDCELNNYGIDKNGGGEEEEDVFMDLPPAFAIPGWAAFDSTIEALIDAAKSSNCGPSLHQRSVAACVGALLPPPTTQKKKKNEKPTGPTPSNLTKLLTDVMTTKDAEAAKEATKTAALNRTDPVEPDPYVPLVVLVGATKEGLELTAVQITKPQGSEEELHCPFGNISVISSVCYTHSSDPLSIFKSSLDELREQIGIITPESEEPTTFVTYGTLETQKKLSTQLKSILTTYGKNGSNDDDNWDGWDEDIPIVSTKEECVSLGLAILAASVHGRVRLIVSHKGTDGKMRPKAKAGISVQDVATCAVAVSYNYFGGKDDDKKWTEPKVIFDFDRRVPAGPYQIDMTAAECAAHVKYGTKTDACCIEDESELIDTASKLEGSKGIPDREAAALQYRFRMYQKTSRSGEWIQVGDDMRPLSMKHSQKDEGASGEDYYVALENCVLEISLNTVGILSTVSRTNGETIVQATKSARNSKLLRWGGIIGSILFIGGFLVKSFVEERIFERDTQRVLAYYKHAAPNSFNDGDERHARYMVWKYKNKKDKLWRRLEVKYNMPVKHAWEWDDDDDVNDGGKKEEEDEEQDLDNESEGSESKSGSDGDEL